MKPLQDHQLGSGAPTWRELELILPLSPDVKTITNLSPDTLKRRYGRWVVQLSPRRQGMKYRHALAIANGTAEHEAWPSAA